MPARKPDPATQQTKPAKGKPITIPVPKRDEIEDLLSRAARPLPVPDQPHDDGNHPEDALRALLQVDPDAPPAKRNEDEPVEEPEPLKDQGDPLT